VKRKKPDILERIPEPWCSHPHMKFDHMGNTLKCIDCKRKWAPLTPEGAVDMLYYEIKNAGATRHSPFEAPRHTKIR
jgi:hypothetical protein